MIQRYTTALLLLLLILPLSVFAQTATVKPKVFIEFNNEVEGWLNESLDKKGTWNIVGNESESNVTFRVQISQNISRAKAKLFIIDSQTAETIWSSETVNAVNNIYNGYAPKKTAIKKLVDRLEEDFDKSKINLSHTGGSKATASTTAAGEKKSTVDELVKLKGLLDAGAITKEEYESMKKKLLAD